MAKGLPYLRFENAKEAIQYYVEVFGARLVDHMPVPKDIAEGYGIKMDDLENTTIHATISLLEDSVTILCSDRVGAAGEFTGVHSILIDFNSEDEKDMRNLHNIYRKIVTSNTCKIIAPLETQFWGGEFGEFIDQFGVSWMFNAQPYSQLAR